MELLQAAARLGMPRTRAMWHGLLQGVADDYGECKRRLAHMEETGFVATEGVLCSDMPRGRFRTARAQCQVLRCLSREHP